MSDPDGMEYAYVLHSEARREFREARDLLADREQFLLAEAAEEAASAGYAVRHVGQRSLAVEAGRATLRAGWVAGGGLMVDATVPRAGVVRTYGPEVLGLAARLRLALCELADAYPIEASK